METDSEFLFYPSIFHCIMAVNQWISNHKTTVLKYRVDVDKQRLTRGENLID
jgi:hypothetical protein